MNQNRERHIGLHVRITDSLAELVDRVQRLNIPIFQLFLMDQNTRRIFTFTDQEIAYFRAQREIHFEKLYVHGSYLINLAGVHYNGFQVLYREISLAKKLGFGDIVLHCGSAHGAREKKYGIDMVARVLNRVMRNEKDLTFILENTAHGNMSIGSDLSDFYYIRQKLDFPEHVRFCFDTSHAHVYGYDFTSADKREQLIQLLDECMGIENIALIHLNDTDQARGSRIDKHDAIGKGIISIEALKNFVTDFRFIKIPIIMELPLMAESQEGALIAMVTQWHVK